MAKSQMARHLSYTLHVCQYQCDFVFLVGVKGGTYKPNNSENNSPEECKPQQVEHM